MPEHLRFSALWLQHQRLMRDGEEIVAARTVRRARHEAGVEASRARLAYSKMLLSLPVWTSGDIRRPAPKRPETLWRLRRRGPGLTAKTLNAPL